METKKKHTEEVEQLNQRIEAVFAELPQIVQNSIQDGIDQLLLLEKKSRLLIEPTITVRITDRLLDLCFDKQDFGKLNASIKLLSKRRSQHDDVIAAVVRRAISYLPRIEEYETQMTLLQTLLDTSEGKIFLEGERASLIRRLMAMRESHGDLEGAAAASREIHVEVCNALSSREKAEFLIEQIRLNQLVGSWMRVPLLIQKMNVKLMKEEKMEDLLEQFIDLCITQHVHDNDLPALFDDHERLLTLARLEESDEATREVVPNVVLLAVLMPFSPEQQQIVHRLANTYARHWKYLPSYRSFLQCFEREELLRWPLPMDDTLRQASLFTEERWGEHRAIWSRLLRQRVIEHNIRLIGKTFTCATLARMAALLQLTEEEAEEALASACQSHMLWLKIDRMKRTVNFQAPQSPEHVLTSWTQEVKDVMGSLDHVVYLIEKEKMIKETRQ